MSSKRRIIISMGSKMLLGAVIGFILSYVVVSQEISFSNTFSGIVKFVESNGFSIYLIVSIIAILLMQFTYSKGSKLFLAKDDEGEYVNKDNVYIISYAVISNFLMIFSFSMFGIFYSLIFENVENQQGGILHSTMLFIGVFFIDLLFTTRADFKMIALVQKKEPMLKTQSDPSSFKFSKEYFSKLDEAQKQHQAMSAFKGAKMMTQILFGFFVTTVFLNLLFGGFSQTVIILGILTFINLVVHHVCAYEK